MGNIFIYLGQGPLTHEYTSEDVMFYLHWKKSQIHENNMISQKEL